jgi:hypothetical protein
MAKSPQRRRKPRAGAAAPNREGFSSERELIVIAKQDLGLRATREGVRSATGADVSPLTDLLASEGVALRPLFGVSEDRLQARSRSLVPGAGRDVPDLSYFYRVEAPEERLDDLADQLREMEEVEAAYVKPPAEPAQELNDMLPLAEEAPPVTPDFTARQSYLDAAPGGIDARYAWTLNGGRGQNVRIIDIEGAWRFSHEDLLQNQGGVIGGTQSTDIGWRNHGTAVTGEFGADDNAVGVTGICPEANVRAIAIFGGTGSAGAIRQAADALSAGDIILIELHRPGPRQNFQTRADQMGYIAVEWWPDDLAAIQYATGRGVIVVEAAGNGGEDLDDPIYGTRPAGFPASWTNPFARGGTDSGAIVVGAGAPPPGTHGRNHGADRSRLGFSNYGALVDVQGWGREVTTTGYGDLQGGVNEDEWYTDTFSGTSSASPIIVGALGCIQGVFRAANRTLLTPATARNLLRTTGSPQQDEPGRPATQRIGNRPNLRQAINVLTSPRVPAGAQIGVVSRSTDKLDIFVTDQNSVIWTAAWEPGFSDWWHGWWELNGGRAAPGAPVHAVSRSTDKLDAFVIGLDSRVYTAAWEPGFTDWWHGWWQLNGGIAAPGAHVTVVSRNTDKLDIFVVGTDGRVYTAAWEPGFTDWWHGWWPIGNIRVPHGAPVHAVSRSADKLDIFVTDVNGVIQTAAWEPGFSDWWHGWWELNGGRAAPGAPVTAVSRSRDKLDVFVVGNDGRVWTAAWEPSFPDWWHGWWPIGQ